MLLICFSPLNLFFFLNIYKKNNQKTIRIVECMLHIRACYIHGHVTYTGMLHTRACYIYGHVTYTGMLHIRACYIYGLSARNRLVTWCYIYGLFAWVYNGDLFNQDKFNQLIYSIKIDLFFHQIRYYAFGDVFNFLFLSKNVAIIVCQTYASFYFVRLLKDCKVSC